MTTNPTTETLNKALKFAAESNNVKFMEWVFTQGNPTNINECMLLAVEKNNKEAMAFLTEKLPSAKKVRPYDRLPSLLSPTNLWQDFIYNEPKFIEDLEKGIVSAEEINERNDCGETILFTLCARINFMPGVDKLVQLLLDNGADVNILSKNNSTALMVLAKQLETKAVVKVAKLLLEKNVININNVDKENMTLMDYVCNNFNTGEFFHIILNHPAYDVNNIDVNGYTSLLYQCSTVNSHRQHSSEIVEMLLKKPNINVNATNKNGETALTMLITESNSPYTEKKLEHLLKHPKIDVNLFNYKGLTPLMLCAKLYAQEGMDTVVKLLLEHPNIKPKINNIEGMTATDIFHQQCKVAQYFKV